MNRFIGLLFLGVCLLEPGVSLQAQEPHGPVVNHQWNDGESNAWHQYLKEQHRKDHDWSKATKREQAAYWKWRDQHHDIH